MAQSVTGRRNFLRQVALGGMAVLGTRAAMAQGQAPAQEPALPGGGANGTLYNPGVVQERAPTVSADNDDFIMAVEKTLKCQCGCNLDVYTCRTTDFTCTTSPALHRDIVALRNRGMTAAQIRDDFVRQYGEQALMAPKPEGFNLAGYFVPGVLMLVGIGALSLWIARRQRQVALAPAGNDASDAAFDSVALSGATPEELERLKRALSEVKD
jgi:cytochrome c-type biogenesis protein CcmH/NrfF